MKAVYITIILVSLITIAMLGLSFFYLDRQRHQTFIYALYYDDVLTGYEKIDRYILESKTIHKSVTDLPRDILRRKAVRKITFDMRGKKFMEYRKELSSNGAKSLVYINNTPDETSFIALGHATFSYLESVPNYGNNIPFESTSIVTYLPLIRRYNFKRRGEQFVNALIPISTFLPPVRDAISITSLDRDTIEIEGRKINCERLVLELTDGELISIWVTKTFHNILMVQIPNSGFKAVFSVEKKDIPVEEYKKSSELYIEKGITFSNEDISLYGTLSVPTSGEAPYPAVILIWNSGPMDRDALGIFTDTAHALTKSGYCVLRFDKRGIGKSQGFFSTYAQPEVISDLTNALDFLKLQPEIDKSRIAILGHSEGGFYASYLASLDSDIRACIVLSARSSLSPLKDNCRKLNTFIKKVVPDDEEYLQSAIATVRQNREIIKGKSDWITIMGKRVFTKKMSLEDKYNPIDAIKKIKIPVLISHGRKDNINPIEEAKELGGALAEAGNDNFTMIYFGELDHFFGPVIKNPPLRDHVEVDMQALKNITNWLDKNLVPLPPEPILIEEILPLEVPAEGTVEVPAVSAAENHPH